LPVVRYRLIVMNEVQDIFRNSYEEYIERFNPPPHICKTIRAIINCRTEALGGHIDVCEQCGYSRHSYNSCRNRNCPKCQALNKEKWILDRQSELLPVPYFHIVFTLPSDLDVIALQNQKVIYNILFRASAETLKELASDPKYLGAEIGFISVLHTWSQTLSLHPHVHMIVPSGGLSTDVKWKERGKKFFLPVKVMSRKFRGKFLYYLENSKLEFNGSQEYLAELCQFDNLLSTLYYKEWYVYCKRPFKTTLSVLEYLGRYTHRVAISNHRIIDYSGGVVTFKWRDYSDSNAEKIMKIPTLEFMRRFLLHVLPSQFTKIRHYGFLGSAVKAKKLKQCSLLLNFVSPHKTEFSILELIKKLIGIDITLCPECGNTLARRPLFTGASP